MNAKSAKIGTHYAIYYTNKFTCIALIHFVQKNYIKFKIGTYQLNYSMGFFFLIFFVMQLIHNNTIYFTILSNWIAHLYIFKFISLITNLYSTINSGPFLYFLSAFPSLSVFFMFLFFNFLFAPMVYTLCTTQYSSNTITKKQKCCGNELVRTSSLV